MAASMNIMVVLDFDDTILDCDSDDWIVEHLGLSDVFKELSPTMPFNSLMDRMMEELHSRGTTVQDIKDCLERTPLDPNIIIALKSAFASGCDLRILSDANVFFIETILKHHGILDCFSEINTNPGFIIGEQGSGSRLKILPYHDFNVSSHGCNICPPNLCKGRTIERIQSSRGFGEGKRIIYIGDGKNDYCPSLKLTEKDYLMPRKNFPLWDIITTNNNPKMIKAKIQEWSNGTEFRRTLTNLIHQIILEERDLMAMELKAHSESTSSNSILVDQSFRKAVQVPQ